MGIRLRNLSLRLLVHSAILLSRALPSAFFLALCPIFARLAWYFLPRLRRITLRNLELCFDNELPEAERVKLAFKVFKNACVTAIEFIYFTHTDLEKIRKMAVKVTGWTHLVTALSEGKGVIGLAMHFGNWEYSGAFLPLNGVPLAAVGKEQRDEFFTELAFHTRKRFGIENIPRSEKLSSSLIRALREGKVLGLLADQNGGISGRFVPFFGISASTVRGPALLATKFSCPLMLIVARRLAPFQFEIIVKPPIKVDLSGDEEKDEEVILTAINREYEMMIREEPAQWLWFHKRFKTRREGDPSLYQ